MKLSKWLLKKICKIFFLKAAAPKGAVSLVQKTKEKMENKKYKTETKIYKFKLGGSGRWTNYQRAIVGEELALLNFAQSLGYVVSGNDAPHGRKSGDYFKVVKYFTTNSMEKKTREERCRTPRLARCGVKKREGRCLFDNIRHKKL